MSLRRPLTIFVPHCSNLLTDHHPHGDGLVAHAFVRSLAGRGHVLHVAASEVDLKSPLPPNVHLHTIESVNRGALWSRLHYIWQVRKLFLRLGEHAAFDIVHQLNPVYTGISLGLTAVYHRSFLDPI